MWQSYVRLPVLFLMSMKAMFPRLMSFKEDTVETFLPKTIM